MCNAARILNGMRGVDFKDNGVAGQGCNWRLGDFCHATFFFTPISVVVSNWALNYKLTTMPCSPIILIVLRYLNGVRFYIFRNFQKSIVLALITIQLTVWRPLRYHPQTDIFFVQTVSSFHTAARGKFTFLLLTRKLWPFFLPQRSRL